MAKKNTKGIIIGVIAVCAAIGALSPDKEAESTEVSVPAYEAEYDIDTEVPVEDSTPDEDASKAEAERLAKEAEEQKAAEEKAAKTLADASVRSERNRQGTEA
ncbi:MAG: hypothetical protein K2N43_06080, partial [Lachnospiraceae bacterium]|nr:hypothetical protein [Lachnospiraceae bacterium]